VVICPLVFFATFPFGSAAAALQLVAPNRIRAQIISLYVLVTNLVGAGFGPLVTGVLTDHVFRSPESVGLSIATVAVLSGLIALASLHSGLRPFREALGQGPARPFVSQAARNPYFRSVITIGGSAHCAPDEMLPQRGAQSIY